MKNLITDVGGLKIGNANDESVKTGVTVILPDEAALCAVDVRGGGPGTRETDLLGGDSMVERVHAIVLSGGSVYGLAAADAVTAVLGVQGIGYKAAPAPVPVSPIVPSAILFDNANGGNKDWGDTPPFTELGEQALANVSTDFELGKAGAGYGATAGALPRRPRQRVGNCGWVYGRRPHCCQPCWLALYAGHRMFLGVGSRDGRRIRRYSPTAKLSI